MEVLVGVGGILNYFVGVIVQGVGYGYQVGRDVNMKVGYGYDQYGNVVLQQNSVGYDGGYVQQMFVSYGFDG